MTVNAEAVPEAPPESPAASRSVVVRIGATVAIWLGGALAVWWWVAPKGYNTSDYGFIVGQSWRVLNGELPHLDFISARPAGSAVLHMLDFVLPLPLVEASKLISVLSSVGIALLAGVAVLGRRPWEWTAPGHIVVAVAALFTINTFQIGPWYTADGLLLALGSAAAFRMWDQRAGTDLPVVALLAAGCAPLVKQSFFLAVPIAAVWVMVRLAQRHGLSKAKVLGAMVLLGVPGLVYVSWIVIGGGAPAMVSQLTATIQPDWVGSVGNLSAIAPPAMEALGAAAVLAVASLLWMRRPWAEAKSTPWAWAWPTLGGLAFLVTVRVSMGAGMSMYEARWSSRLFWLALICTLIASAAQRRVRTGDLAVVAAAWMSGLSWGMPWPLLVSGGLLIVVAQVLADPVGDGLRRGSVRAATLPWLVVSLVALALTATVMRDSILNTVIHRDRPASQLTAPLRPLDPDFGRVLTNPTTAQFLKDAIECQASHPSNGVVFGSWNSDLYAMLGVRNPLATDGANNYEIAGAEEQYRRSVRDLAERGDFLVLFPLVNPESVHILGELPSATVDTPIPEYWFTESVPYAWMADTLGGQRVACGSWIGVWEPEARS